jgi:protein-disulfide isomerase
MAKKAQLPKQQPAAASATRTAGTQPASKTGPRKTPATKAKRQSSNMLLLGVIAAVALVAVVIIVFATRATQAPIEATNRVGEGTAWGPADAPVKIVEYSDYGCHFCKQFSETSGEQLRAMYESTDKVRFDFKHLIIGGPSTANAANAAECAADQGKFWDYHDVLFQVQGSSADPFTKTLLKQYAAQLGLDTAQFNSCVDADQHLEKVYRDSSEGQSRGVNATPTFFIGEQKVEGAQPLQIFQSAVEAELVMAESSKNE